MSEGPLSAPRFRSPRERALAETAIDWQLHGIEQMVVDTTSRDPDVPSAFDVCTTALATAVAVEWGAVALAGSLASQPNPLALPAVVDVLGGACVLYVGLHVAWAVRNALRRPSPSGTGTTL